MTRQFYQRQPQNTKVYKASTKQAVNQAIMANETSPDSSQGARVAVQAMAIASVENNQRVKNVGPKLGRPIMTQLTFDWTSIDKYAEIRNFRMEVTNMFKNYNTSQVERVPIIKKTG